MKLLASMLLLLACASAPAQTPSISLTDFGASPDSHSKSTPAFQKALASLKNGGTLHIPPGHYLTGQIILTSNITLDLAQGATITFSPDPADYPIAQVRWEGTECYSLSPLIVARDAQHITITGQGTLDGNGQAWWPWSKKSGPASKRLHDLAESNTPVNQRQFTPADFLRPNFLGFYNCQDIHIQGITIQNSPMWIIHPVYCDGVTVRNCTIKSTGPNTDGCDPDSSSNVLIEGCTFNCGDDSVAIKSGRDADGRRVNRPSHDIIIHDCTMIGGHSGVAIGSEAAGSIRHVIVTDCTFTSGATGIRLKTMRGRGGTIEDIRFDRIDIAKTTNEAIILTMNYQKTKPQPLSDQTPTMHKIEITNVTASSAKRAILIAGLPERPIENITLSNITISADHGLSATDAKGLKLENVKISPKSGQPFEWNNATAVLVDGKPPAP